jgi:hypothetical protein
MLWQRDMPNSNDAFNELKRLQIALMAISADLDAVERVHRYSLEFAAENLNRERSHGIEDVVSNFAAKGRALLCDRWRGRRERRNNSSLPTATGPSRPGSQTSATRPAS